jgi:thiamine-monophosphate kinase
MKRLFELGERAAIDILADIFSNPNIAIGIGDDCAAIELGEEYLIITTDMISQKTHMPKGMTPYQIGWFIVAINLSDIAAKGGEPIGIVLSFGLPKNTSEDFLRELAKGANNCATTFNTTIIGGDLKESNEINLCGTAIGLIKKNEFMSRTGIKVGDIVAVTGKLGKAGAGYYSLNGKIKDDDVSKLIFEPFPRLEEGRVLSRLKCVTSCMDISDGLSSSLYQLQKVNNVGFEIKLEDIHISKDLFTMHGKNKNLNPEKIALHFGGDYELLVTIKPEKFKLAKKSIEKIGNALNAIGYVIDEEKIILVKGCKKTILKNLGYEHFKQNALM